MSPFFRFSTHRKGCFRSPKLAWVNCNQSSLPSTSNFHLPLNVFRNGWCCGAAASVGGCASPLSPPCYHPTPATPRAPSYTQWERQLALHPTILRVSPGRGCCRSFGPRLQVPQDEKGTLLETNWTSSINVSLCCKLGLKFNQQFNLRSLRTLQILYKELLGNLTRTLFYFRVVIEACWEEYNKGIPCKMDVYGAVQRIFPRFAWVKWGSEAPSLLCFTLRLLASSYLEYSCRHPYVQLRRLLYLWMRGFSAKKVLTLRFPRVGIV